MAVEAIQAVTELEERVKKQKEAAATQNKQRLLEAQRTARLLVEQSRQQAEGEARQKMAQAEAQAAEWTQQVLSHAFCPMLLHKMHNIAQRHPFIQVFIL